MLTVQAGGGEGESRSTRGEGFRLVPCCVVTSRVWGSVWYPVVTGRVWGRVGEGLVSAYDTLLLEVNPTDMEPPW